jgi:spermidine synthase
MHRAQNPAIAVRTALTLIGFSAVIGQTVLLRELIVVFNGNEMSLGIMLAAWLFWTAAGTSLSSSLKLGNRNARRTVALFECLLAASLPPTIWALRASKSVFQIVPGELVGPVPMLLSTLACLSVFCAVSGALFVTATRMFEQERAVSSRLAVSTAYLFEALGSGVGGIVAGLVLLLFLESFQIAIIVAVLNLSMSAVLLARMTRNQTIATALTAALCAIPLLVYLAPALETSSRARLWQGFRVIGSHDSIYGNLTVTETGDIRTIYDNGLILANVPDESAAEESVHYALLEHPAPRRILLIGGGANGSIAQALEHSTIDRIDYVELDPALIAMSRQFFPAQYAAWVSDPRVHTHYSDGRRYLKNTADIFDVIILSVPDPQTAQLNRYYTVEFFRSARDHLAPGGLLALELRSSEETISPNLAEFLRCVQRTLNEVFSYTVAIPGDTIHFFATTQPGVLTDNPQILISRLRSRKLQTKFVREYFIPFRMMPDRMMQVRQQLQPLASTPVNRDFEPIAYYFDIVLWSGQFKAGYSNWFRKAARIPFSDVMFATLLGLLVVAAILALMRNRERRARAAATFCAAATGFTLITLQVLLLLAFQFVYGYVYHQLTILIAMNMTGIALGSWLGIRRAGRNRHSPSSAMATVQLLLALSAPALIFAVTLLTKISGSTATWLATQCIFPALAALCGALGGYQFPIASEIYLNQSRGIEKLGTLYAVDLLGGCVGALMVSTYLVPVFGFWRTAALSAAIGLAPALLALRVRLGRQGSPA